LTVIQSAVLRLAPEVHVVHHLLTIQATSTAPQCR